MVTYLHKTRLSRFLHVEFNIPLCRATRSQYYFSIQSYGFLKTAKTSNLKAHNNEKMAVKEKKHISTSFKRTFKIAKILAEPSRIM